MMKIFQMQLGYRLPCNLIGLNLPTLEIQVVVEIIICQNGILGRASGEKFLILDSQNDQGIVMSNFELRRIDEFKRLYEDSRIKKDKTKCKFLNNLVENAYEKDAISFYNKKCLQGE